MLEVISTKALLARPRYVDGWYLDNRLWWKRDDLVALNSLVAENADIEKAAASLGRGPTKLAHKALDTGLRLPKEWRSVLTRRQLATEPRQQLQYPYIVNVRGEHATLLAVNRLVPHGLPSHLRADVCQEMMLAVWSGATSLEALQSDKALVNSYIREARKLNYEGGGFAMSLDVPMMDGRSWYDVLPDPNTMTYG